MELCDALVPAFYHHACAEFEFEGLSLHTAIELSSVEQSAGVVNSNLCSVRHCFASTLLSNFDVESIGVYRFSWLCFFFFVSIAKVLKFLLLIWNNCLVARMPVGWADFTIFVSKLERLNKSQRLVNRSAN